MRGNGGELRNGKRISMWKVGMLLLVVAGCLLIGFGLQQSQESEPEGWVRLDQPLGAVGAADGTIAGLGGVGDGKSAGGEAGSGEAVGVGKDDLSGQAGASKANPSEGGLGAVADDANPGGGGLGAVADEANPGGGGLGTVADDANPSDGGLGAVADDANLSSGEEVGVGAGQANPNGGAEANSGSESGGIGLGRKGGEAGKNKGFDGAEGTSASDGGADGASGLEGNEPVAGRTGTGSGGQAESSYTADGKLDINRATAEELDALPGVGPAKAKAIVEDRERNGPFSSVESVERVKGIGPKMIERWKNLVVVSHGM
ncbi:competence protein ComEA [Paenibacillaceae bacterium GAS479]|nr:competence protein ComEA [Paenibacillaceae bacterium GAS479]